MHAGEARSTKIEMKLLLIGCNYAPEPIGIGVITAEFAQLMTERGHSVTVATTFPHYPQYRWQRGRQVFALDHSGDVTIRRMWTPLPRRRTARWRIVYDTGFGVTALLNARRAPRPDAIIAVCPPVQTAFAAAWLARRWGVPSCLWVKDLPLDLAVEVGLLSTNSITHRLGSVLEKAAYGSCTEVVVLHERFAQAIARKGVARERIKSIPNWVTETRPRMSLPRYRRMLGGADGDFVLLHAGNMGAKQGLDNILAAASILRSNRLIRFALMGDGPRRDSIMAEAGRRQLTDMVILPLQADSEVPYFYAAADALLLDQVASVVNSVVPMKLLSYMAAGKPIVAAVHPESVAAQIVKEADCGLLVPPGRPTALAEAARELSSNANLDRLGRNARQYMEKHFGRTHVISRWEELLAGLSGA